MIIITVYLKIWKENKSKYIKHLNALNVHILRQISKSQVTTIIS